LVAQYVLSDEENAVRDVAQKFARERLAGQYMVNDRDDAVVDRQILKEMGTLGLIAPEVDPEYGGSGLPCTTSGLITETLAAGDFNTASLAVAASLVAQIISAYAQENIAQEWVASVIAGDALVGLALTEPGGGSDAASLRLSAKETIGGYVLNGEKTSITAATQADAFVVFARTGTVEDRARGVSAFLVSADDDALTRTRFRDAGNRAVGRGSLFFDDVFVPADHMLGDPGKGFVQVMQGFDYSRPLLGLLCLGSAQASLDETWRYVNERHAFDQPLSAFQGVTFPLAECETHVAAARELCYHALRLKDAGMSHSSEAAMCKWLGPKTAYDTIHQCLLTFGHYGYSMDLPHQQRMRDVMAMEIGDGTAQIMKMVIARQQCELAQQFL